MNNKMKWPDLSDIGVYFGSYRDVESKGSGLSVVDMTDQHAAQIASLGFTPAKSQYGAGIYVKTGYSLSAAMLDFFNNINEDGTLARLEEKYLGHGNDFDYLDTRTFLRAVENILPEVQPLFEKYAREIDWRLLAAIGTPAAQSE